ncbi:hypothetical protein JCM9279_007269 [Rhodotorula babjevae]
MSALDQALLREDLDAPVSIATLVSLSPAQLALAALRPDLDFLTRARAYVEFLMRRSAYRSSSKRASQEQPILEVSLNFERPASLTDLSSSELLLLLFNPRCISAHEAEAAQQLFFDRAHAQKVEDELDEKPAVSHGLHVERCDVRYAGGVPSFAQDLVLEIEGRALVLWRDGKVMVKVQAQHISNFWYLTTIDSASEGLNTDFTLKLEATQACIAGDGSVSEFKLKVALGRVPASDPDFKLLRSTVATWSVAEAFSLNLTETRIMQEPPAKFSPYPTPPTRSIPLPDTSPSDSLPRSRSTTATASVPPSNKRPASSSLEPQPQGVKRVRTAESREKESQHEGVWRYVGALPEGPLWHPGHLVRQLALLRAIMPSEVLLFPDFSPDDLALLSRATSPAALPYLPWGPPPLDPSIKHRPHERLALENIYRNSQRLDLETTRLVLLTDSYPDVRLYAQKVAKVRDAIEALKQAYSVVALDLERRIARRAPNTQDPLDSVLDLVRKLRDSPDCCRQHFFHEDVLIRVVPPSLDGTIIGWGPLRRFETALMSIVLYEQMAGSIS